MKDPMRVRIIVDTKWLAALNRRSQDTAREWLSRERHR